METDARPLLKRLPRTGGSAMALQRVALPPRAEGRSTDEGIAWRRRPWGDGAPPRQVVTLNAAMVSRIAQHLRAREWARAMRMRRRTEFMPSLGRRARRRQRVEESELTGRGNSAVSTTSLGR